MTTKAPFLFDEFFASGKEETLSPFIFKHSRHLGYQLSLKRSLTAGCCLALAWPLHQFDQTYSFIFLLFTYFLAGTPALIDTIRDLLKFEINIDVLMTLAAFLSVVIGSPFEGALLLVLFAFSGSLEEIVESKTKMAITHLHDLTPKFGSLIHEDGSLHTRSVRDIPKGSILLIRSGDTVPLDGEILEGTTSINMAHLTGEALPISKTVGATVAAGSINCEGAIKIKVTSTFTDSTLAKMITLITSAQENKPKLQRFIDTFDTKYAKTIIALFFLFAAGLPWITSMPYFGIEGSIYRSLAFLIAASPCALVIATPTAYLSAISCLARKGVLLKGGSILDAIASCRSAAFDKTGTLTQGDLTLIGHEVLAAPNNRVDDKELLAIALALEHQAIHPIARAIEKKAKEENIIAAPLQKTEVYPGLGIVGELADGSMCGIGNASLIKRLGFKEELPSFDETSTLLLAKGHLVKFTFLDTMKPLLKENLDLLRAEGIEHMVIISGDKKAVVEKLALSLPVEEARGELSPQDKLDIVTKLAHDFGLLMVGDGINDAPALARATVGISMGQMGSATAVSASDVVLIHDDLSQLAFLKKKAIATKRIVTQNVTLALIVILFATTPALLGLIPLWLAVLLHEGGTVLVGLNSLRLLRK